MIFNLNLTEVISFGIILLLFVPVLSMLIENIKKMKVFRRAKKANELIDKLLAGEKIETLLACGIDNSYIWEKVRVSGFNRHQLYLFIRRALQLAEEHKTKEHEYLTACAIIKRLSTNDNERKTSSNGS